MPKTTSINRRVVKKALWTPIPAYRIDPAGNTILPSTLPVVRRPQKELFDIKCKYCKVNFRSTLKDAKYCKTCAPFRGMMR